MCMHNWLTVEQASERVKMPKSTIKNRVKQGFVKGKIFNGKLYVDYFDLFDMIKKRQFILYDYLDTEREEKHGS